eukprot:scaffold241_cov120-Skeletonema_marinoi.AAC.4
MYDYATPYIWTLKMRQNFPQAYLLTSRSANHGIGMNSAGDDKACLENIQRYFEGGHVDFVDGFVCESPDIGELCTIQNILAGSRCDENPTTHAVVSMIE